MSGTWELYVCDRTGVRVAPIDPYTSAEVVGRVNDVSTWSVDLPTNTAAGQHFITDSFARLEVVLDAQVWRSGPVTHLERSVDIDGDNLQVTGVDDTVWLARRNAHPQPGTPTPPYSSTRYDIHTGSVSQVLAELVRVNAGESATTARKVPGLTAPPPEPAGPNITVYARWQNLLTFMADTARPHGILFDIVDLTFSATVATDRGAVFSAGLETLASWKMVAAAPTSNFVVVAGQGESTARMIRESQDPTSVGTWGRAETFMDRRDTSSTEELDTAAQESLAESVTPVTVVFTPLDTDAQAFGRDWQLGDLVTVKAGGLTVYDQVREVHLSLDQSGATVTPSVGAAAGDLKLFRTMAGLDRRVRQLERI